MLVASEIYKVLKDKLHELDKERAKFYNKVEPFRYAFWTILILGGAFLVARLNLSGLDGKYISDENISIVIIAYFLLVIVTLITFLIVNKVKSRQFKKLFTSQIAPYIIRGLDPSFKYKYEGQIPRMEVIASLLFPPFSKYDCQDLVTGVIDNIPIKFAEINLQKIVVQKDSTRYVPVFTGILYKSELEVKFPTSIWFVTKGNTQSIKEEGKTRIKLEESSVKNYRIYADDGVEARKILQPFILEKISALNIKLIDKKIIRKPLSFHFENNTVQIAIPTRKKFMEPKLSRTIDHVSFIEEQTTLLNAISNLMEDLTLK